MNEQVSDLVVYFNSLTAGHLKKIKHHRNSTEYTFQYTEEYFNSNETVHLSVNLPKNFELYSSKQKLPSFFDNLVSEGWLRDKQTKALNLSNFKEKDKFYILAYFGYDLIGSVSIKREQKNGQFFIPHIDYVVHSLSDSNDSNSSQESCISIASNSTISGVQKKVLVKKVNNELVLTIADELSTHIAKLKSETFPDLIELEYLSTRVIEILLPNDEVQNVEIHFINELNENALIIKRFDRYYSNNIIKRKQFEEFNQIFNKHSDDKYDSSYDEMGKFLRTSRLCKKEDILKLFQRILAYILIGNTDAHLKNFSMFHNDDGSLSLTPMYDIVASSYYPNLNTLALAICGNKDVQINNLKPKNIVDFALNSNGFELDEKVLIEIIDEFKVNKQKAINFLQQANINENVQKKLIQMIQKRWNGTFEGIKSYLNKKKK